MSKRQAELAVRKLYLFNFWYAAGFCKNVRDDAFLATKLLDTHVLIWRSRASERLLCITDECPRTGRRISEAMAAPLEATDDEGRDIMCVSATCRTTLHSPSARVAALLLLPRRRAHTHRSASSQHDLTRTEAATRCAEP